MAAMGTLVEAVLLKAQGEPVELGEVMLPEPGTGQVRVRVAAAGVCHSDLSLATGLLRQPVPAVLGHEGVGVVAEVGEGVLDLSVGEQVVFNWAPPCAKCWHCVHGEPYLCPAGAKATARPYASLRDETPVFPGIGPAVFARETVVAARALIRIPVDFPSEQAALLGCAALTGIGAVVNSARVRARESVCVIGLGGVGLAVLQGARQAGASPVIAVDLSPEKEALARTCGATHFLTNSVGLPNDVRELTGGVGADHVFEAVGQAGTIRQAWDASRRGGRVTVVGVGRKEDLLSLSALEVVYFGRTFAGCVYGSSDPVRDVPLLIDLASRGEIDLSALITEVTDLSGIPGALERLAAGQGGRTVVRMA
jgi:S-(hydroxymethyl)glutathione dehydrogenase/alcohol dehydrogenase